jgi:hypothetical protein
MWVITPDWRLRGNTRKGRDTLLGRRQKDYATCRTGHVAGKEKLGDAGHKTTHWRLRGKTGKGKDL